MKVPSVANKCAAREIEIIEDVGSVSNNPEKNFQLLHSTYSAAADGVLTEFQQHGMGVHQILTPNGNTILHIYIRARRRTISKQERKTDDFVSGILEMCPDLLWQANKKGETLLHLAARCGHADVAKLLLDECKKPWQNRDQEGGIQGTRRMLQMASYKAKDTALHEAVRYNHRDVVEILTKEDPTLPYEANTACETPLYLAAERQHAAVLKAILDNCDSPADGGPYDRTALHMAVFRNDKEMTELLLGEERTFHSRQDQQGWTPLHFAAHFGYIEILKKILAQDKCAAYTADNEGKTALHVATAAGKVRIMEELLSTCPGCCELEDNRGRNVLHFALRSWNIRVVFLALRNPSLRNLVNEKDENGNTPFLQADNLGRIIYFHGFPNSTEVDKLAFNHDNHNAADIISANKSSSLLGDFFSNIALFCLEEDKVNPGMRTRISKNDNGKSKSQEGSKDGDINRALTFADKIKENILLAATLMATVSFAAGITIPGGLITDKGTAVLTGNAAFRVFVVLNTLSFCLSSLAVFFHLFEWAFYSNTIKHLLELAVANYLTAFAMLAMIGAFLSGTSAVLHGPEKFLTLFLGSLVVMAFFFKLIVGYNGEFITLKLFKIMLTLYKTTRV